MLMVGYYPVSEQPVTKKQWIPSGNASWADTGVLSVHMMGKFLYRINGNILIQVQQVSTGDIVSSCFRLVIMVQYIFWLKIIHG